ncbi:hypothetical protein [Sulfitobacter sp. MOLA879]|uniref:hypothetical protein n=1 Tax=Sulfitobacter sp. MOLA879 TaxID=3368579 RepID=UPI0037464517
MDYKTEYKAEQKAYARKFYKQMVETMTATSSFPVSEYLKMVCGQDDTKDWNPDPNGAIHEGYADALSQIASSIDIAARGAAKIAAVNCFPQYEEWLENRTKNGFVEIHDYNVDIL